MTPAARIAAAAEILDRVFAGEPVAKVLANWARGSRFAGSGDRAAVRDHVFDVLRRRASCGWLGGSDSGRHAMIGLARAEGWDLDSLFNDGPYSLPPLSDPERLERSMQDAPETVRLDCPEWTISILKRSLGSQFESIAQALRHRAPVFLRANLCKTTAAELQELLAQEGAQVTRHPLSPTALEVLGGRRNLTTTEAFQDGLFELQDAASQAIVDDLPLRDGMAVLDFCAGGGGKALAMAARADVIITAHDANASRMRDLNARADRAGVRINQADFNDLQGRVFDMVLCDVPCSGSGAWRRNPHGKWTLTQDELADLRKTQGQILDQAVAFASDSSVIAYVTCSLFDIENKEQITEFLKRNSGWGLQSERILTPLDGGDGFYLALLRRETP